MGHLLRDAYIPASGWVKAVDHPISWAGRGQVDEKRPFRSLTQPRSEGWAQGSVGDYLFISNNVGSVKSFSSSEGFVGDLRLSAGVD